MFMKCERLFGRLISELSLFYYKKLSLHYIIFAKIAQRELKAKKSTFFSLKVL